MHKHTDTSCLEVGLRRTCCSFYQTWHFPAPKARHACRACHLLGSHLLTRQSAPTDMHTQSEVGKP